ncbi:MAG: DUF3754 domain-containing protein [Planctomycetota bacterium]
MPAARPNLHRPDDRFVPVRLDALVDAIDGDPGRFGPVAGWAQKLARSLERVIGLEANELHRHLDRLYAAMNPDLDTLPGHAAPDGTLHDALCYLLGKANFTEMDDVGIKAALAAGSVYGLRVKLDPEMIERLSLHVRGRGFETHHRRHRVRPWRTSPFDVEVFPRLVVVAQIKGEDHLRLKLFRDIPMADVEALLPHARVQMSVTDRLQIIGGGAGSLGGVAKVAAGGAVSTTALAVPVAIGLGGLAIKSFLGYRRKKHQRTSHRTQHLYDKNIANNAAVLHTLCRMIAQEECKEALLAYAVLASGTTNASCAGTLDKAVERFLRDRFALTLDFDGPDACGTLRRLGLAAADPLAAIRPEAALAALDELWRDRRTARHHVNSVANNFADGVGVRSADARTADQ